MKIMQYPEREALKKTGVQSDIDMSHYHRFLDSMLEDGVIEIPDKDVPISLEEYVQLKKDYPGWSYGIIQENGCRWKEQYNTAPPRMNKIIIDFMKNKRK